MEKDDILIHYIVTKKEHKKINMKKLIKMIYRYVQNHEIYFKYDPTFYEGVLLFGIVGFQKDHDALQEILGNNVIKLNCNLTISEGKGHV